MFLCKQKTAYEMRISDWSSDVCSSDLQALHWQGGLYYMNIKRRDCVATEADLGQGYVGECYTTDPRAPTEALRDDSTNIDVYAAFGSLGYSFDSGLNVQGALRYDREVRHSINNVPVDARTPYVGNQIGRANV